MNAFADENSLSMRSTVAAAKGQISTRLADEIVILDLKSGIYYGLDEVGVRIWELLQTPQLIGEIRDTIATEYDVEPTVCERELLRLLQDLAAKKLIEVKAETEK